MEVTGSTLTRSEALAYLKKLADAFDHADRIKADYPGEGASFIDISHELALEISRHLREAVKTLGTEDATKATGGAPGGAE